MVIVVHGKGLTLGMSMGTNSGPELLLELDRDARRPLRAQLEDGLREAVRSGRLPARLRLPATRALASDLGVSRRLVVDAYGQLLAEGYLVARRGAGTYVAPDDGGPRTGLSRSRRLAPSASTSSRAPRTWPPSRGRCGCALCATCCARRRRPRSPIRTRAGPPSCAARSPPTCGACAASSSSRTRSSSVPAPRRALALLGRVLTRGGMRTIAVEDPGLPPHRAVLAYAGMEVQGVPVDEHGLDVGALSARVVLTTPAHQCPTGVVLSPERRGALVAWARAGGLVIEDDYDAEFRYDRAPLGALQGLAPDRVVYLGTASKTLAPGLRLGWLVLPASLIDAVVEAKHLDDFGSSTIEQLVLARLLETAAYDRHLRQARRRNRARRDALIAAVARDLPQARVSGISAGLHALVRLASVVDIQRLMRRAARRSLGVYPLELHLIDPSSHTDALVLGYANLSEPAIEEGIRRLGAVLKEL